VITCARCLATAVVVVGEPVERHGKDVLALMGGALAKWAVLCGDDCELVVQGVAVLGHGGGRLGPWQLPGVPKGLEPIGDFRMLGVLVAPAHPVRVA